MDGGLVIRCSGCGQRNRVAHARLTETAHCGGCRATIRTPGEVLAVDDRPELESLLGGALVPVLVDFWAPWCGPCRVVGPAVAKVASDIAGRMITVKVNTDADTTVGDAHAISAIPTLAIFHRGREVNRVMGARPPAAIQAFVNEVLAAVA